MYHKIFLDFPSNDIRADMKAKVATVILALLLAAGYNAYADGSGNGGNGTGQISTYHFNSIAELLNAIKDAFLNAGLSEDEVNNIMSSIDDDSLSRLPSEGVIILNIHHGSLYTLGVVLPHEPPLNIGDQIQAVIFYSTLGDADAPTINDIHVYAVPPSGGHNHIQRYEWVGYPKNLSAPDPFFWVSNPLTIDEVGTWYAVLDYGYRTIGMNQSSYTIIITLETGFGVVPESIIGTLGVLASSFAVIAYKLRR